MCDSTHLVVKTGLPDHADENVVGLAGDLDTLLGNVTEDTNGNTRTGEGVSTHERLVDAELATNCLEGSVSWKIEFILSGFTYPHFILEQESEWLNKL